MIGTVAAIAAGAATDVTCAGGGSSAFPYSLTIIPFATSSPTCVAYSTSQSALAPPAPTGSPGFSLGSCVPLTIGGNSWSVKLLGVSLSKNYIFFVYSSTNCAVNTFVASIGRSVAAVSTITQTANLKPQTHNPNPQSPNPKPHTPNPKPQTPNPKPQTTQCRSARGDCGPNLVIPSASPDQIIGTTVYFAATVTTIALSHTLSQSHTHHIAASGSRPNHLHHHCMHVQVRVAELDRRTDPGLHRRCSIAVWGPVRTQPLIALDAACSASREHTSVIDVTCDHHTRYCAATYPGQCVAPSYYLARCGHIIQPN